MKTISIIILLLLSVLLSAQTITVKQDGTGDFTTIQAAVDSAQNGDTVLVWPGIYFENINYNGKNIVLGSLLLTTGNESYKYNTIIDGYNKGSCVVVNNNETNAELTGFTLQHGKSDIGGGINLDGVNFDLDNCIIKNNKAKHGGGINCIHYSNLTLSKVTITNNYVTGTGGGIAIVRHSNVTFDSVNRCNIYLNYASRGNEIHKVVENDTLHVYLDTCTVLEPDYHFFSSIQIEGFYIDDIVYDIQHAKLTPVDADLYVNPVTGNDSASGLSANEPLKTIAYAYSKIAVDSNERNTIHLANGIYSDTVSGERFPLNVRQYVNVTGQSRDGTILDGEYKSYLLRGNNATGNYSFSKMTIKRGTKVIYSAYGWMQALVRAYLQNDNISFDSILFTEGWGKYSAGSVNILGSNDVRISNCEISNNTGGPALNLTMWDIYDTSYVSNCKIINNKPDLNDPEHVNGRGSSISDGVGVVTNTIFINNDYEAVISTFPSENYFSNCTFVNNAYLNNDKGSVCWLSESTNSFYNSIIYDNNDEVPSFSLSNINNLANTNLNIYYSLIEHGEDAVYVSPYCNGHCFYYYDTTNIDTDPLFYGGAEFPYNLSDESPCIDAGTLDLPQIILDHMPETDLAGNPRIFNGKIDMGAYEWNPTVSTKEIPNAKQQIPRLTAAPNPFTTQTTISAKWDNPARINIEIYNNAGLLIKTLQSGSQPAGSCKIFWNGTDNIGNYLPTGVYVVVLRVDGKEFASVKVVKK